MVDVSSSKNSITITVGSANKNNSVAITPSTANNSVTTKSDTAQYWSNLSKDYSEQAKTSAYKAEQVKNEIITQKDSIIADIENTGVDAVDNITTVKSESIASVEAKGNEVLSAVNTGITNINTAKTEAVNAVTTTKTTILQDIEFVADGEKKEIEELIDNGKEEIKESIGDVKVLTTLKIGQIGIAPLGIDETLNMERYLNGQIIIQDQFKGFTQFLKKRIALYPSIACLEDEWQAIVANSAFSQCGKFVIDDNAGTIRLPKVVNIQGLTDLSKLGEIVEAGLPNITGSQLTGANSGNDYVANIRSGAFNNNTPVQLSSLAYGAETAQQKYWFTQLNFDASLSNPIYSKSNTVQQEQIQYPYFIQVATGAETEDNIINTLELNNPFVLLEPKFFKNEIYNISWLLANGSYNGSSAVHPSAYQALLVENNSEVAIGSTVTLPIGTEYTKQGLGVKLSTDSDITDYDFVVNTSDEAFRLPIKVNLASGKAVVGNGLTLGLTNGTGYAGLYVAKSTNDTLYLGSTSSYGQSVGEQTDDKGSLANSLVGITTDPTKSGIETSDSGLYLYFYVGETVQNANLINAGRIEEKLADKADRSEVTPLKTAYITETYVNGTSWYRIWSDGWIEQGGVVSSGDNKVVTLLKPYSNTNYTIQVTAKNGGSATYYTPLTNATSTTQFGIYGGGVAALGKYWHTYGY